MRESREDCPDIPELLRAGESAAVEFKSTLADMRRIVETVAAMATIGGGTILVGVRPDGTPIGADIGEDTLERLVQRILGQTDPRVYVDVDTPRVAGKRLLRIRVPPGDGPHLANGRAYYRSGPATVPMNRDEYERRLLDRLRESSGYERSSESDWSLELVDDAAVRRFVERARPEADRGQASVQETLERLHLLRAGRPSVAALLLFGTHPQGPLPQATVRVRVVRGALQDAATIEGTLFQQIDRAVEAVSRNLRVRPVRRDVVRRDVPELPPDAVREVMANAVAHRDYRSTAPIQVSLDDQQLTVWNPGHLPPPLTPAMLRREHPSVPPNPHIARALYLAGYIEEWGTGTLRVIEAMRAHGNAEALFSEDDTGGIRVVLPLPGASPTGLPPRQAAMLERLESGEPFTTADYAERAGVSHRTALDDLRALESVGLVRRTGRGRRTSWLRT